MTRVHRDSFQSKVHDSCLPFRLETERKPIGFYTGPQIIRAHRKKFNNKNLLLVCVKAPSVVLITKVRYGLIDGAELLFGCRSWLVAQFSANGRRAIKGSGFNSQICDYD